VEINRTVIERMIAPLEHVLRNAVVHGIEPMKKDGAPASRRWGW
jgi:chemosensory pili system protein ChpA (sensor histidine kinase/response regulator)